MSARAAAPLRRRLLPALGPRATALRVVVRCARAESARAFLVGGPVRDLLLRRTPGDLDVLLSTRAERVARRAARELGARLVQHESFLTARLELPDFALDLAQARRERYVRPGALPTVEPASVEEDLRRRDFSIHALALPLERAGGADHVLDLHGGLADLHARRLRILHACSFEDDPTRMYRAARYSARLGFRIERSTLAALRSARATGAVDTVSGPRLRNEIELLLGEAAAERAVRLATRLELFDAISPGWRPGHSALRGLARLDAFRPPARWPEARRTDVRLAAALRHLLADAPPGVRAQALERLRITGRPREGLEHDLAALGKLRGPLARSRSRGRVDALLAGLGEAALLYLHTALRGVAAARVLDYAAEARRLPTPLDGQAAHELGLRGPAIGAFLRAARARALDGRALDAGWRRRWLARWQPMG